MAEQSNEPLRARFRGQSGEVYPSDDRRAVSVRQGTQQRAGPRVTRWITAADKPEPAQDAQRQQRGGRAEDAEESVGPVRPLSLQHRGEVIRQSEGQGDDRQRGRATARRGKHQLPATNRSRSREPALRVDDTLLGIRVHSRGAHVMMLPTKSPGAGGRRPASSGPAQPGFRERPGDDRLAAPETAPVYLEVASSDRRAVGRGGRGPRTGSLDCRDSAPARRRGRDGPRWVKRRRPSSAAGPSVHRRRRGRCASGARSPRASSSAEVTGDAREGFGTRFGHLPADLVELAAEVQQVLSTHEVLRQRERPPDPAAGAAVSDTVASVEPEFQCRIRGEPQRRLGLWMFHEEPADEIMLVPETEGPRAMR